MKNIILFLRSLVVNRYNRLKACMVLAAIFGLLSNYYDWALYVFYIPFGILVIEALILFAHAWVINPIRDILKKK